MVRCASCGHEWLAEPSLVLSNPVSEPVEREPAGERLTRDLVQRLRKPAPSAPAPNLPAAAMIRARQAKRERMARLRRAGVAWGTTALALAGVMGVAAANRDSLARVWPKSASLFTAAGLEVNVYGLGLERIGLERVAAEEGEALLVRGLVRNLSAGTRAAPPITLELLDRQGAVLAARHVTIADPQLANGEQVSFEARFPAPPPEAVMLQARFDPTAEAASPPEARLAASDGPLTQ